MRAVRGLYNSGAGDEEQVWYSVGSEAMLNPSIRIRGHYQRKIRMSGEKRRQDILMLARERIKDDALAFEFFRHLGDHRDFFLAVRAPARKEGEHNHVLALVLREINMG